MSGSENSANIFERIRYGIIEADTETAVQGTQISETPDRFNLKSREEQMLELARLTGVREGLSMARVIVEEAAELGQ